MAAKEWMCSIVLTDGNIIKIKATEVEWDRIIRMILVHNERVNYNGKKTRMERIKWKNIMSVVCRKRGKE